MIAHLQILQVAKEFKAGGPIPADRRNPLGMVRVDMVRMAQQDGSGGIRKGVGT